MAASDFFARWSKPAVAQPAIDAPLAAPGAGPQGADAAQPLPGIADARDLAPGAGIAAFMQAGVDEGARRLALKRLFADPHFNRMDGLDIYVGDYNTFTPMSAALVASLEHGKALLADYIAPQVPPASLLASSSPPSLAVTGDTAHDAIDPTAEGGIAPAPTVADPAFDGIDPVAMPSDESNPHVVPGL